MLSRLRAALGDEADQSLPSTDLPLRDVLEVLDNERRRHAIDVLAAYDVGEHVGTRTLADRVAAREHDCDVADLSSQQIKRAQVGLHQHHAEILDDADVIDWVEEVDPGEPAGRIVVRERAVKLADLLAVLREVTGDERVVDAERAAAAREWAALSKRGGRA